MKRLDPVLVDVLKPHLQPGEALLWVGRPEIAQFPTWDGFSLAFGSFPAAMGLAFGLSCWNTSFPLCLLGGAVAILLLGTAVHCWMQPMLDRRLAACLTYGVSDRRVILVAGGPRPMVRSYGAGEVLAPTVPATAILPQATLLVAHDPSAGGVVPGFSMGQVCLVGVPDEPALTQALNALAALKAPAAGPAGPTTKVRDASPVDPQLSRLFAPHLAPRERLVWAARPSLDLYPAVNALTAFFGFVILFGVVWITQWLQLGQDLDHVGFALPGLGLIGLGLAMIAGPPWARRRAARLAWGLTDRRALFVDGAEAFALDAADVGALHRTNSRNSVSYMFTCHPGACARMPWSRATEAGFTGVVEDASLVGAFAALAARPATAAPAGPDPLGLVRHVARKERLDAFRARIARESGEVALKAEAVATASRRRTVACGVGLVVAIVVIIPTLPWLLPSTMMATPILLSCLQIHYAACGVKRDAARATACRMRGLDAALGAFAAEAHPKSAAFGWVDPRDACVAPRYRRRGDWHKVKHFHRHRWARLAWMLLDGSMLTVAFVDKVKRQDGKELRREPLLEGRFWPNPVTWDVERLPPHVEAHGLVAHAIQTRRGPVYRFKGALAAPADAPTALAALLAALRSAP